MAYFAGPSGYVSTNLGSVTPQTSYAFEEWKMTWKSTLVDVTNFTTLGAQLMVPAVYSGTIVVKGPYNSGTMAALQLGGGSTQQFGYNGLPVNPQYFCLGFGTNVFFTISAWIESMEISTNVKSRAEITITAQSSGSFTAVLL